MRHALLVLALFAPACGATPDAAGPAAVAHPVRPIDVQALKADLDRGAVPILVDVRTPGEFRAGHVPGAVNIPVDELSGRLGELGSADREVYVICEVGGRSARAASALAGQGFRPVDVTGGTAAWRSAGLPMD